MTPDQRGYSLLELAVAVSLTGVIAMVATSLTGQMYDALQAAEREPSLALRLAFDLVPRLRSDLERAVDARIVADGVALVCDTGRERRRVTYRVEESAIVRTVRVGRRLSPEVRSSEVRSSEVRVEGDFEARFTLAAAPGGSRRLLQLEIDERGSGRRVVSFHHSIGERLR